MMQRGESELALPASVDWAAEMRTSLPISTKSFFRYLTYVAHETQYLSHERLFLDGVSAGAWRMDRMAASSKAGEPRRTFRSFLSSSASAKPCRCSDKLPIFHFPRQHNSFNEHD